jgi:nitroimidazol reductase NimA-like FMN-containing flavoprotein (pyridoxamine 5'-phosphate oxidase superfamily)
MPIPREQLRLTDQELDELLANERTLRAATVSPEGLPHVVPLWFVWHDGAVWVNSLRRSKRTHDVAAGSAVALCVDTGVQYEDLRGAVLYGRFTPAADQADLSQVKGAFARKYWGLDVIPDLTSHEWLLVRPDRVVSWDFRKIPAGRDRRMQARKPSPGK